MSESCVREIFIEAPPAALYEYFVDPAKMVQWKGVSAELDPRAGGQYRVNVTGEEIAVGEYKELVPFERVIFTWGWEGNELVPPGSSTVTVTFTPQNDGTLLKLEHSDLPSAESITSHGEGWTHYLERLQLHVSGTDPGPDPWITKQV